MGICTITIFCFLTSDCFVCPVASTCTSNLASLKKHRLYQIPVCCALICLRDFAQMDKMNACCISEFSQQMLIKLLNEVYTKHSLREFILALIYPIEHVLYTKLKPIRLLKNSLSCRRKSTDFNRNLIFY
jgi:hypothetical protein